MTRISVVVPVYNAPDEYVATCVEALVQQECRGLSYEVILVDDGSSDRALAPQLRRLGLAHHESLVCIETTHAGPAVARNVGIEAAQGELVAFTDVDCVPRRDWLARCAQAFLDPDIDAAGGLTVSYSVDSAVERYSDHFGSLRLPLVRDDVRLLIACNSCWRTSTLRSLGGFHQAYRGYARAGFVFKGFEDFELSVRAARQGCRVVSVEDAIVAHRHRRHVYGRMQQFASYGAGYAAFLQICPEAPRGLTRYEISDPVPMWGALRSVVRETALLPIRPFRREYDGLAAVSRVAYPMFDYLQRLAFHAAYCRASRRLMARADQPATRGTGSPFTMPAHGETPTRLAE